MNIHKPVIMNTLLASLVCAIFQVGISFVIFSRNGIEGAYPAQLLGINFVFSYIATFIPLLCFNIYTDKKK